MPPASTLNATAVAEATKALRAIVEEVEDQVRTPEGLEAFLDAPAKTLSKSLPANTALLTAHGAKSFNDINGLLKSGGSGENAQEAIEDYWSVLDDWEAMLAKIDKKTKIKQPKDFINAVGAAMPTDVQLVNVRDNAETTLDEVVDFHGGKEAKKVHLILLRHLS